MKRKIMGLVLLASMISCFAHAATYTYTGSKFNAVSGLYTTEMRVTGSFNTDTPIPPNIVDQDISGMITSYSFSDGLQTIDSSNGTFNPLQPIAVTTDSMGNITKGQLFVLVSPLATEIGQLNSYIALDFNSLEDLAKKDVECTFITNGFCARHSALPNTGFNASSDGLWVTSNLPSSPIPTLSLWSLLLLVLVLGMAGMTRVRQHT